MTNIIRDRSLVAAASTADLVATYNAITGNSVERFSSRAVAERRVDMAIMAAEDAAGHRGVPKGTAPVAETLEEVAAKAQDAVVTEPKADEDAVATGWEKNPFKPGTMAHQLWVATKSLAAEAAPRKKPEKVAREPKAKRSAASAVKATFAGISKVHAGSTRAAVLAYIQNAPKSTATLAQLDAAFNQPTRGYVQKLMQMNHVVFSEEA